MDTTKKENTLTLALVQDLVLDQNLENTRKNTYPLLNTPNNNSITPICSNLNNRFIKPSNSNNHSSNNSLSNLSHNRSHSSNFNNNKYMLPNKNSLLYSNLYSMYPLSNNNNNNLCSRVVGWYTNNSLNSCRSSNNNRDTYLWKTSSSSK